MLPSIGLLETRGCVLIAFLAVLELFSLSSGSFAMKEMFAATKMRDNRSATTKNSLAINPPPRFGCFLLNLVITAKDRIENALRVFSYDTPLFHNSLYGNQSFVGKSFGYFVFVLINPPFEKDIGITDRFGLLNTQMLHQKLIVAIRYFEFADESLSFHRWVFTVCAVPVCTSQYTPSVRPVRTYDRYIQVKYRLEGWSGGWGACSKA